LSNADSKSCRTFNNDSCILDDEEQNKCDGLSLGYP
jgi:hypothetical protein